jgi:glycosyltransferase involved in cell wall biosynthesis
MAENMLRISVIICSLNPRADYFRRVLECLEAQSLPKHEWELLVVDNASDRRLSDSWDLSWHPHHVHIREEELGLTPARLRGIKEANGDLLVFIDDDNLVAPDYLERVVELERGYPHLKVFGAGTLEPEFESEPRPEVRPLLTMLGLRTVPRGLWTNNPKDSQCLPWGAGLCVTRSIATAYVTLVERLRIGHVLDRRGLRLFSGGDDLFSWVSARAGWGFGIFPNLRITHLVRSSRVNEPYLFRLVHDHAYSHGILKYVLWGDHQPRLQLVDTIRILLHGLRRGRFSMRCQWAAARGTDRAARVITGEGMHPIEAGEFALEERAVGQRIS